MVYKCIFYINNEINVYQNVNNDFICLRYNGKNHYSGDIKDLFSWFLEKIGYVNEKTKLDLCVLSKEEFDLDYENYNFCDKSSWTGSEIREFLFDIKNIETAIVKLNGERFLVSKNNTVTENRVDLDIKFYPSNESINLLEEKAVQNKKQSLLAKYYREKTEKIKKL